MLGFPAGALGSFFLVFATLSFEAGAFLGHFTFVFEADFALSFFVASPFKSGTALVFALGFFVAGPFDGRQAAGVIVGGSRGGQSSGGSKQTEGSDERKQGGFHGKSGFEGLRKAAAERVFWWR